MVFIFRTGVIHLDRQVMDERLLPGRDVQLEESVQGVVDRAANEVATCYYPSREQTHNNVRYPTVCRALPCLPRPPRPAKTMNYRWAYLQLEVAVLRDSLCHFEIRGKVAVAVHLSARCL